MSYTCLSLMSQFTHSSIHSYFTHSFTQLRQAICFKSFSKPDYFERQRNKSLGPLSPRPGIELRCAYMKSDTAKGSFFRLSTVAPSGERHCKALFYFWVKKFPERPSAKYKEYGRLNVGSYLIVFLVIL